MTGWIRKGAVVVLLGRRRLCGRIILQSMAYLCLVVGVCFLEHQAVNEARVGEGYFDVRPVSEQAYDNKANQHGQSFLSQEGQVIYHKWHNESYLEGKV